MRHGISAQYGKMERGKREREKEGLSFPSKATVDGVEVTDVKTEKAGMCVCVWGGVRPGLLSSVRVLSLTLIEINTRLLVVLNREFTKTMKRPFGVKYNPYTQSVQVLRDTKSITSTVNELRYDLDVISDALARVSRRPSV